MNFSLVSSVVIANAAVFSGHNVVEITEKRKLDIM